MSTVLVTGATGYIGGRLIPRLLEQGHRVRAMVRDFERVDDRAWAKGVEVVHGDLLRPDSLGPALDGVDTAYYLVHSMGAGAGYRQRDQQAVANFIEAAQAQGDALKRVVYLGGLQHEGESASEHLASRAEVGARLRDALPVTEFRAGPIIGSGSASFECVRYLTERLPLMITPRWVKTPVRPIAIRDVLAYLLAALDHPPLGVLDIGAEPLAFRDMMTQYAQVRGLIKRIIIPTPVLAPGLAARWVGFFTPIPNAVAVPLVRGMTKPIVGDTARSRALFPQIAPTPYRQAVGYAIERLQKNFVETRWSGSAEEAPLELGDQEGLLREVRRVPADAPPWAVYAACARLGGDRGWPASSWAWKVRGWMDQLVGGPGLRRGRRHPKQLLVGEAVDFWRVEALDAPKLIRLRAEMKVPGRAWLQFESEPDPDHPGRARLTQTALFESKGLLGVLYWWSMYPMHLVIFGVMARRLARDAEHIARDEAPPSSTPAGPAEASAA
ncbi:MAG: SDR family oxidoreductase [Planctomycetota bacterium]